MCRFSPPSSPSRQSRHQSNGGLSEKGRIGSKMVGFGWIQLEFSKTSQQILNRLFTDPVDSHPNSNLRKFYVGISVQFLILFFLFKKLIKSPRHRHVPICPPCRRRATVTRPGALRVALVALRVHQGLDDTEKRTENQTCNIPN